MAKVYVLLRCHRMETALVGVYATLELAKGRAAQDGIRNYHGDAAWRSYHTGLWGNGDYQVVPHDLVEDIATRCEGMYSADQVTDVVAAVNDMLALIDEGDYYNDVRMDKARDAVAHLKGGS